jgi:hypothetical protein
MATAAILNLFNPQKLPHTAELKILWIPFIKLHKTVGIFSAVCGSFWGLNKFKMAAVAMVTKVQNMLNGNRTADPFET